MKRVEFKPPKGWTAPEGATAGTEFTQVFTCRMKPNGDICLTEIGETPMPGYGDKAPTSDGMKEMAEGFSARIKERMTGY